MPSLYTLIPAETICKINKKCGEFTAFELISVYDNLLYIILADLIYFQFADIIQIIKTKGMI